MPHRVGTNEFFSFNAVDLSDHVRSSNLPQEVEKVEDTTMGDQARSYLPGLFTHSIDVVFAQDYAASEVEATLSVLYRAKTVFTVAWRADSAAASATNPEYSFSGFISSYNRGNQVGELQGLSVTITPTGGLQITRTAP